MQEIEIKFKVDDIEKIKVFLLEKGSIFTEELDQKDIIYVPDINDISNGEGKIFVRIRNANGNILLTLKQQSSKIMQSKEIEFNVSDFKQANDFLETLGLARWVEVHKRRTETSYQKYNICLDSVDRLGDFVEIEVLTEDSNHTEFYEQEILKIALELGIDPKNRVNNFYDTMIHELNIKEKESK